MFHSSIIYQQVKKTGNKTIDFLKSGACALQLKEFKDNDLNLGGKTMFYDCLLLKFFLLDVKQMKSKVSLQFRY